MISLKLLTISLTILFKESNESFIQVAKASPKSSFYPFGRNNGDSVFNKVDDAFVGPIPITITFPFFGKSFTSVYVITNGILTFNSGVTEYQPNPFPLLNIIGVAPYWTDINNRVGGEIYFREVISNTVLNQIGNDIRRAYPVFVNFRPIWAYIVTYDEVAEFGSNKPSINITTQAVIATNGRNSFTIFNYGKLMWPVPSSDRKAQAGFNAGDGKTYFVLPGIV
jgi:alpha-tectorin